MANRLAPYRSKRDFNVTKEPRGNTRRSRTCMFVVQQHHASHMHYDLRLEIDGVLVSWAIPKGPSLNPRIKRLAIMTEDHPRDYASFEGIIPEGQYGAGAVIVWDKGTYKNSKQEDGERIPMSTCLEEGRIEIELRGKKLKGAFALVRMARGDGSDWLLIKMKDEHADARRNITASEPESVKSGMTLKELEKESRGTTRRTR